VGFEFLRGVGGKKIEINKKKKKGRHQENLRYTAKIWGEYSLFFNGLTISSCVTGPKGKGLRAVTGETEKGGEIVQIKINPKATPLAQNGMEHSSCTGKAVKMESNHKANPLTQTKRNRIVGGLKGHLKETSGLRTPIHH